jgi:hypothetical protein
MKLAPLVSVAPCAFALFLFACTTKTITTAPAPEGAETQAPAASDDDPADEPGKTAGPDADGPQGIGALEDEGLGIVKGDPSTPKTCKDLCSSKGGSCVQALDPGQGGGAAVAGVATYLFIQPGKPAAFLPYDLQTCATPVPATQEAINDTGSLYAYECSCDGIAVPPRATVLPEDGIHTCKEVCTSWGKTCTNARTWEDGSESGALAFYGSGSNMRTKALNCATAPAPKLDAAALSGYWCACE